VFPVYQCYILTHQNTRTRAHADADSVHSRYLTIPDERSYSAVVICSASVFLALARIRHIDTYCDEGGTAARSLPRSRSAVQAGTGIDSRNKFR
jgi:hypothetical protein